MSKNILEEIRKEQVLNATKKLIIDKGYSNFSMKDVAAELDMSTGMIYHYFENKEELLLQALKYSFKGPYRKVMETVEPLPGFWEKIDAYFDNVREAIMQDVDFYILFLNYLGQVPYAPDVQHIVRKFLNNLRVFIDHILDLGEEKHPIKEDIKNGMAELIVASSMGIAFQYIVDPRLINLEDSLKKQKDMVIAYLQSCLCESEL